ncbi:MAG: hypothetical protein QW835_00360 [Candidatus Hadarchaeum sp.]
MRQEESKKSAIFDLGLLFVDSEGEYKILDRIVFLKKEVMVKI